MNRITFVLLPLLLILTNKVLGQGIEFTVVYRNALILAYSAVNNVYEDDNICIEIYDEKVWAKNKTSKTIYLDYSKCFLYHNTVSFPMFSTDEKDNVASKLGVSTSIDQFISIAPTTGTKQNPTFICDISSDFFKKYSTQEKEDINFTEYEIRFLNLIGELVEESRKADKKRGKECLGTVTRHLTENESINTIGISVAYAFDKNDKDWNTVTISNWVCDVIFAPYYIQMPKTDNAKKGFAVKKVNPVIVHVKANSPFEYDEEKSPLIVADWEGDYKKGYFTLKPLRIHIGKNKEYYKRIINFNGENAPWKELKYLKVLNPNLFEISEE